MTPVIFEGLQDNPTYALHRNADAHIAAGQWLWKLTDGDKLIVLTYLDDLEPIERWFLQAYHLPVHLPIIIGARPEDLVCGERGQDRSETECGYMLDSRQLP